MSISEKVILVGMTIALIGAFVAVTGLAFYTWSKM
jgi:hypothetical protein